MLLMILSSIATLSILYETQLQLYLLAICNAKYTASLKNEGDTLRTRYLTVLKLYNSCYYRTFFHVQYSFW